MRLLDINLLFLKPFFNLVALFVELFVADKNFILEVLLQNTPEDMFQNVELEPATESNLFYEYFNIWIIGLSELAIS